MVEEEDFISHGFTLYYTLEYKETERNQFEKASVQSCSVLDPEESSCEIQACKKPVFINSAACETACFNRVTLSALWNNFLVGPESSKYGMISSKID